MNQAKFLLDEALFENNDHQSLVPETLSEKGFSIYMDRYKPGCFDPINLPVKGDDCLVIYGGISFVEQRLKGNRHVPGAYYSRDRFKTTFYQPRLPMDLLLNADAIYLPFAEFERRAQQTHRLFGASRLFIRPDSGVKTFTGLCIHESDFDFEINSLKQITSVTCDTLVQISAAKEISSEYRFFIIEGRVVTGSQYMREGEIHVSPEVDPIAFEVATKIASHPWQIDLAYACDIGMIDGLAKVVELNAFSTSGLYACDGVKLFENVANCAIKEYQGDISIIE